MGVIRQEIGQVTEYVERMHVLETARLAFREMSLADRDFVGSMLSDPEVMRFYPEEFVRAGPDPWIERQLSRYRRDGHGLWLVLEKVGGQPVGMVGLSTQDVNGVLEPEVGYLIHRPFWRRGFATEAALAVRDHAFTVLDKPRVVSLIRPQNTPSQGVAKRLGMTLEGRAHHRGLEHLVYAVSRMETLPGSPPV
jgi:RimJ/RimL family protein N-acetyltransferase